MPQVAPEIPQPDGVRSIGRSSLAAMGLSALGIVFGDIGTSPLYTLKTVFALTGDTPIAAAINGCVIKLSRGNTIWMRRRCSGGIFHRGAVFNRRTWPLVHLTICSLRIK
jgi:K+ potassium transporter